MLVLVFGALTVGGSGVARADGATQPPTPNRVLHVPTGHMQSWGQVYATGGGTHRAGAIASVATGLGKLAEIDIGLSDHLGVCSGCIDGAGQTDSLLLPSGLFKIGLGEGEFVSWQPALALGFRKTFGATQVAEDLGDPSNFGDLDDARAARLFAVASKTLGPLRLHVGVDIWDAEVVVGEQREALSQRPLGERVRPFAGVAWTPSIYPRTSLIGDVSWVPVMDQSPGSGDPRAELRWLAGWGVRYQALDWVSTELAVRHREGGQLDDSTVMLRFNAVLDWRLSR